jgi:hypothetical protein
MANSPATEMLVLAQPFAQTLARGSAAGLIDREERGP